jgi:hypothetical protein
MNNGSSSTGVVVGVLIAVIILIVGFIAYKQGYFEAQTEENTSGIQVNL